MAKTETADGPIQPELVYTTAQLAKIFGVGTETLNKKYIHTGKWKHTCLFRGSYAVPGWVVIRDIEGDLGEWEGENPK